MTESLKIAHLLSPNGLFQAQYVPKHVVSQGSAPDTTGGAYNAPHDRLVSWWGGYPVTIPHLPQCAWHLKLGRQSLKYLAPQTHPSFSFGKVGMSVIMSCMLHIPPCHASPYRSYTLSFQHSPQHGRHCHTDTFIILGLLIVLMMSVFWVLGERGNGKSKCCDSVTSLTWLHLLLMHPLVCSTTHGICNMVATAFCVLVLLLNWPCPMTI